MIHISSDPCHYMQEASNISFAPHKTQEVIIIIIYMYTQPRVTTKKKSSLCCLLTVCVLPKAPYIIVVRRTTLWSCVHHQTWYFTHSSGLITSTALTDFANCKVHVDSEREWITVLLKRLRWQFHYLLLTNSQRDSMQLSGKCWLLSINMQSMISIA